MAKALMNEVFGVQIGYASPNDNQRDKPWEYAHLLWAMNRFVANVEVHSGVLAIGLFLP